MRSHSSNLIADLKGLEGKKEVKSQAKKSRKQEIIKLWAETNKVGGKTTTKKKVSKIDKY